MNAPRSGSRSEAPPTATPISPGSTILVPARPVNAVRSACSRNVTRRSSPVMAGVLLSVLPLVILFAVMRRQVMRSLGSVVMR